MTPKYGTVYNPDTSNNRFLSYQLTLDHIISIRIQKVSMRKAKPHRAYAGDVFYSLLH